MRSAWLEHYDPTPRSLAAGGQYFAVVFALGFVLGVVRLLVTRPLFGEIAAVLLEAPVILSAGWFVARWCIGVYAVPPLAPSRLIMGGFAFALTMLAELVLSVLLFHVSLRAHFATYAHVAGQIGLAAQVLFALIPWAQGAKRL